MQLQICDNKSSFQLHNNHVGLQRKFQVFVPRGF